MNDWSHYPWEFLGMDREIVELTARIVSGRVQAMTINLKPETERLVQEELQNGHFRSVDEMIAQVVR